MFEEPELHLVRFPHDHEAQAQRERQRAEGWRRYRGQLALTLIELGLNADDATTWSEAVFARLFVVARREGGGPCVCSCHPRLPDSDFHDYGFACGCQLTPEERRRQLEQWRATLNAYANSPAGTAERARRLAEENDLASWLAGQPDVVISGYGGYAPEQWTGSVAGHRFFFRERHDCWRIELDLRPTGRFVQAWRGGDLDDEDAYEPREIEEGEVIAEGVVDVAGYGRSPVERATFIVQTIRDHLTRQGCDRHVTAVDDLEQALGRRPQWCPDCGTRLG